MSETFDSFSWFDGSEMTPLDQTTWADYWKGVIPDGVVQDVGNEMRTFSNSTGLYVYVDTGACMVDNHRGVVQTMKTLPITTPDPDLDRIDVVVARAVYGNENESTMCLDILTGTADADPVAPEITQSTGATYEVKLAEVRVPAGAVTIAAENVSDFRNVFSGGGVGAVKMKNGEADPLSKGELVIMSETEANTVMRCGLNDAPIGVVMNESISAGAVGNVQTISGARVEIKCDTDAVSVGDTLIPSTTAGQARTGGGYGAGYALEAKEAGAVGNVKAILAVMSKLRNPNRWYLVDGITEENVIAAYKFKGVATEQEALTNVNEGTAYPLTVTGSVTWTTGKGLFFPAEVDCYVNNTELVNQHASIVACAFGYSDMSTGSVVTAGTTLSTEKGLIAKGGHPKTSDYEVAYYKHVVSSGDGNGNAKTSGTVYSEGTLAFNYGANTTSKLFHDGLSLSLSGAWAWNNRNSWTPARVFTTCTNTSFARGTMYLSALVFYNTVLTDAQHVQLANQINAL